uniref:Uncharacterized protein n=1 Tax=Anguilla anguilla TaxID=7936 RepID=A0A0E9Q063_ANGAN
MWPLWEFKRVQWACTLSCCMCWLKHWPI